MSTLPPSVPSVGAQIRSARELRGISRERLAAQVGTSSATLARLELNDQVPNVRAMARLASALDLSLDDILNTGVSA